MQLSALPGPVSPAAVVAAGGPVSPGGGGKTMLYSQLVYKSFGTVQLFTVDFVHYIVVQ
jgi:hypothetical protein